MNIIQKILNKKRDYKPRKRVLYAITKGTYLGNCVVFIDPENHPQNGIYAAIAFGGKDMDGGMEAMDIPAMDVENGIKHGILDKIRKIPEDLYALCCAEYEERLKRNLEKFDNEVYGQ